MKLIKIICLWVSLTLPLTSAVANTPTYRSGDVLLISLNCYVCSLIERSTGAPYSHSGLLLERAGKWWVAQALGSVHVVELERFLALKKAGTSVAHLRPKLSAHDRSHLWAIFAQFEGLPFDSHYLWDDETLYCSEFIAKFFQQIDPTLLAPKPIEYGADDIYWRQIQGPNYNEGELGNSPADLLSDSYFKLLGLF